MPHVERTDPIHAIFNACTNIRENKQVATTLGYGPRLPPRRIA